ILPAPAMDWIEELLGDMSRSNPEARKESFSLNMTWLRQRMQHIPADADDDTLKQYDRCYLMMMIVVTCSRTRATTWYKSGGCFSWRTLTGAVNTHGVQPYSPGDTYCCPALQAVRRLT
ncbi:hypothetical protein PIB30_108753, partial [Stylosanthes scabra]|nr:hypothetical protein [Stylosanthes scabra]